MTTRRFVAACGIVFLMSQVLAVLVHGVILNADYTPFRGTLLRSMENGPGWPSLFLPVAHLSFAIAFVSLYAQMTKPGPWLSQGLRFGVMAWLMAQVPLWLLWYAEQPWPGSLVVKQLALELMSALALGVVVAAIARRSIAVQVTRGGVPSAVAHHS